MRPSKWAGLAAAFLTATFAAAMLIAGASAAREAGPAAAKPVTLTFWQTMNEEETVTLTGIVKRFERTHPGIKIKMVYVPFDQAQNKFATAAQAGKAPDVLRAEIAWIADYAARRFLADLTKLVSAADRKDYLPAPFAYGVYRGKVWGIPQVTDAPALLYNRAMFRAAGITKVPATMGELASACQKLGPGKGIFLRGDSYFVQPWVWGYGGGLVNPLKKEILIASKGSVAGMTAYLNLFKSACAFENKDFANDYPNHMTAFKNGQVGMIVNGPWATADVFQGPAFKVRTNLGIAPVPRGPAGQGSPVGGHNYVIARTAKVRAAYTFIRWLSLAANQAVLAQKNNLLPTRRSAYDLPAVKKNWVIQGFLKQMLVARNRPVIPEGGAIYTDFTPNVQKVLTGQLSPSEGMLAVANAWKQRLFPTYTIKR